jgi:hypothetical protein
MELQHVENNQQFARCFISKYQSISLAFTAIPTTIFCQLPTANCQLPTGG